MPTARTPTPTPTPTSSPTVSRLAGTCPVCEARHKLTDHAVAPGGRYGSSRSETGENLKMVHHGYRRPGDGEGIVGDCFAVGRAPYEISCDATRDYLALVETRLAGCRATLARHLTGEIRTLYKHSWDRRIAAVAVTAPADWTPGMEVDWGAAYAVNSDAARTLSEWIDLHRNAVRSIEHDIATHEREVARLSKLIADWQLRPVFTVEELEAPKAAERASRKQARVDARVAKLAKKIAFYQKRVDSGVRQHKPYLIAEAFEAAQRSLRNDFNFAREAAVSILDRDSVFAKFGLEVGVDARDAPNREILLHMSTAHWAGVKPLAWPPGLG